MNMKRIALMLLLERNSMLMILELRTYPEEGNMFLKGKQRAGVKKIVLLWQGGRAPLPDVFLWQVHALCPRGSVQENLLPNLPVYSHSIPVATDKSFCLPRHKEEDFPERLFRRLGSYDDYSAKTHKCLQKNDNVGMKLLRSYE